MTKVAQLASFDHDASINEDLKQLDQIYEELKNELSTNAKRAARADYQCNDHQLSNETFHPRKSVGSNSIN